MNLFSKTAPLLFLSASLAGAASTSINTGSLGAAANGTNSNGVTLSSNSPLKAPGDSSAVYGNGSTTTPVNTIIPFNAGVNPASSSAFSIEFWVNPGVDGDNGWAPVFNRVTSSPRSGWTFFQRGSAASGGGWNFALYNGDGSTVGKQITGGGSSFAVGTWTHVVGIWDGVGGLSLYINGQNTGASTVTNGTGLGYNASTSATFSVGSYETGANSTLGVSYVDETAFYNKALTPAQVLAHYNAAASTTPGVYSNTILADAPQLYLQNIPEPTGASLSALGLLALIQRRRRRA